MTEKTSKYLIVLKSEVTSDIYLNLVLLVNSLIKNGQQVEIAVKEGVLDKFKGKLPLNDQAKIINVLPEQKTLLQFPGQKETIKSIQWTQSKEQLNIYITMEDGTFNSKSMEVLMLGENYAEIVFFQTSGISELGDFADEKFKYIFESNIASIGSSFKDKTKQIEEFIDEKHSALSEDTYNYLTKRAFKLDEEGFNLTLAGIMYATTNFKADVKSPETFITCAELVKSGATTEKAQKFVETLK
jgi:hypothetical protein